MEGRGVTEGGGGGIISMYMCMYIFWTPLREYFMFKLILFVPFTGCRPIYANHVYTTRIHYPGIVLGKLYTELNTFEASVKS